VSYMKGSLSGVVVKYLTNPHGAVMRRRSWVDVRADDALGMRGEYEAASSIAILA